MEISLQRSHHACLLLVRVLLDDLVDCLNKIKFRQTRDPILSLSDDSEPAYIESPFLQLSLTVSFERSEDGLLDHIPPQTVLGLVWAGLLMVSENLIIRRF